MDIQTLKEQKELLQKKLGDPETMRNAEKIKQLSIEFSRIEKRLHEYMIMEEHAKKIVETEELLQNSDHDIKHMAQEELHRLQKEKNMLEQKFQATKNEEPQNVIMEIRAGTGGQEAALFAKTLFNMYSRFAEKKHWGVVMLNESKSELGGYKEVIFEITGENVWHALRGESGVHRVQRIPDTEKNGRIHTSTVSVAVLPKAREVDVEIKPQDMRIEFFRSSGPGGQNVNKVETAVRITHIPSGFVAASQESRSQQKNRERAMEVLRAKLFDAKMQEEAKKIAAQRRQQIGTGDRSEKIRTYNFPQDRVTDHRIKESWHNISSILEGDLNPIISSLQ